MFVDQLLTSKDFFTRSGRVLEEADSNFRPQPEMMTVAQHVAHVAHTLHWFVQGVSRPGGFDLDFQAQAKALESVTSLTTARELLEDGFAHAIEFINSCSPEFLATPLPEGPIMGGQPTSDIVWAMVEHTAHHRGALTVYCRLLGKVPVMPYGG